MHRRVLPGHNDSVDGRTVYGPPNDPHVPGATQLGSLPADSAVAHAKSLGGCLFDSIAYWGLGVSLTGLHRPTTRGADEYLA